MKLSIIGLGGHEVIGYDHHSKASDVDSLQEAMRALDGESRQIVWVMVPAGAPTNETIAELAELLSSGDLVVDGGNSHFHDSARHGALLADRGMGFVDAGVSGGVWGLDEGYCIMGGGADGDVDHLRPIFDALVVKDGFAHVGPVSTGHLHPPARTARHDPRTGCAPARMVRLP